MLKKHWNMSSPIDMDNIISSQEWWYRHTYFVNNLFNSKVDYVQPRLSVPTWRTRFDSPVFWANCFRSLASGFWLIAKYDFMVRSWWCLNDVRIRFVLVCPERLPPEPGDWLPSYVVRSSDDWPISLWSSSTKIIVIGKKWQINKRMGCL